MRKVFIMAALAAVLSVQAFAQDANQSAPAERKKSEIVLKAAIAPAGHIRADGTTNGASFIKANKGWADREGWYAGIEYHYFIWSFLGIGPGVKHQFLRDFSKQTSNMVLVNGKWINLGQPDFPGVQDLAITDFYLSLKPKLTLPASWGIDYAYILLQGGYGLVHKSLTLDDGTSLSVKSGLYYAFGAGVEFNTFLFELIFAKNRFKIGDAAINAVFSATSINVGYRFGL